MATLTWARPGDDLDDFVLADSTGAIPSTSVPATYPIAIGGHPYKLELDSYGTGIRGVTYRRTTLDAFRQAQDQSATPGEQSRSTEGYWLRSQRSFLYGAGQLLFDSLDDGVDNLVRRQRWLDNWNCEPDVVEGVKMLRGKEVTYTGTDHMDEPGKTAYANGYTYFVAGGNLQLVSTSAITLATGFGTDVPTAVASDGYTVWVSATVDATHIKIYSATAGSSSFAALSAGSQVVVTGGQGDRLFYANGFLLFTHSTTIYSVSATGALSAAIDTIAAISVTTHITSITASTNTWYFVTTQNAATDVSSPVYKLSIDSAGAFGKVSVALPTIGPTEILCAIKVIGSVMLLGTSRGFRVGTIDGSGNVTLGPLNRILPDGVTGAPSFGVTEFARFGDKVLASYAATGATEAYAANIDSTFQAGRPENGTIVIDLGLFVTSLQPAWWFWWRNTTFGSFTNAMCFVAEHQTTPVVICYDRVFVIGTTNLITPCSLVTSWVTFGLDASKSYIDIEVFHDPLATGDSVKVYYQAEDTTTWNLIGTSQAVGSISNPDPFSITASSRRLRFAFVMTAGSAAQTTTPRVRRWELRAFPAPKLTDEIIAPVILFDKLLTGESEVVTADMATRAEYEFLAGLAQSGQIVVYQEGTGSELVKVSKLELQPAKFSIGVDGGYAFYQGWCNVRMLTL